MQAVDVAGLQKLQLQVSAYTHTSRRNSSTNDNIQTITNLVMVLGFMVRRLSCSVLSIQPINMVRTQAHGYATHEFEVTEERLGVYLPVCQ